MTQSLIISNPRNKGKGYALFLAVLPLLIMYRAPFTSMSLTTILVAVGVVFAFMKVVGNLHRIDWGLVLVLALYLVYVATKSTGTHFLLPIAIIIHIAAITTGIVSEYHLRRYIEVVSVMAAICVILQQLVHIATGFHIPFIYTGWLSEEQSGMREILLSGYGSEGMYRPSSFFLEPSHFSQYVIYGLGSSLFRTTPNIKKAALLTFGLFATTSGMGFVLSFAIWGWWYLTFKKKLTAKNFIPTIIVVVLIVLVLFSVLSNTSFFSSIMSRFISGSDSDYNAINGRLFFWDTLFGDRGAGSLVWGFGEQALAEEEVYFTGFMK